MRRDAIRLWGAVVALLVCAGSAAAQPPRIAPIRSAAPLNHDSGLPPVQRNVELVGRVPLDPGPGNVNSDLAFWGNYAFVGSYSETSCSGGGFRIVDISNPAQPHEVAFVPALPETYHGEGAHAIRIETPSFTGDVLAVSNERCGADGVGGFDLYDISDPRNPVPLVQGFGDFGGEGSGVGGDDANSAHSVFTWQDGNRAYAVLADNEEFHDVDIFDITNPRNPQFVDEFDLREFDVTGGVPPYLPLAFTGAITVREVGGVQTMLVSYWDAGWVMLDVDDPANPQIIGDSEFPASDPLTGFPTPEGNANSAAFTWDGELILGTTEDLNPYRTGDLEVTTGTNAGTYQAAEVLFGGHSIGSLPDHTLNGPTVFGGYGCEFDDVPLRDTVFPMPLEDGEEATIVLLPGPCLPDGPIANADAAGWDAVILKSFFSQAFCFGAPAHVHIPSMCVPNDILPKLFGSNDPDIGDVGEDVRATAQFDGWGYVHLYDSDFNLHDVDAIEEARDPAHAYGFGDLSVHDVATDPTENLAYFSWYSGGFRVYSFGDDGLTEQGAFVDGPGNNFWGVEQFTTPQGERLIGASDRDFGLYIFRYTGPGAPQRPVCPDSQNAVGYRTTGEVRLECTDANGNPLTRTIVSPPARGTLGPIDQARGTVSFTDNGEQIGQTSFRFRANDGAADSATATATISIVPREGGACFNPFHGSTSTGSAFGDRLQGTDGSDRLAGEAGGDCLFGLGGDDDLSGGADADELNGGTGADRLDGGTGNDRIEARDGFVDQITCGDGLDVVVDADPNDRIAGDCEQKPTVPADTKKKCQCSKVSVETSGWGDLTARGNARTAFSFRVKWRMQCAGAAGGCQGRIEVSGPKGTDFKLSAPKKQPVQCKGACKGKAISQGRFRVAGMSAKSLDQHTRTGKRFKFVIKKYCLRNGKLVRVGTSSMTVAYGPNGRLDKPKSDLNGDGKPDRRKPKKKPKNR